MNNDMVLASPERDVSLAQFEELRQKAEVLIKSGFLPAHIRTPEGAVAIAVIGRELGIPMMIAFRNIYVIQGSPTCKTELQLALARRTGELEQFEYKDEGDTAYISIKRKGQNPVTTSFGMLDAQQLGLSSKDNWKRQPKVMRMWRALSANLKLTFPDATGGLYTPEEINPNLEVDSTGSPVVAPGVDGKPALAKPTPKPKTEVMATPAAPRPEPAAVHIPTIVVDALPGPAKPSYHLLAYEHVPAKNGKKQYWKVTLANDQEIHEGSTFSESSAKAAEEARNLGLEVTATISQNTKGDKTWTNFNDIQIVAAAKKEEVSGEIPY